MNIPLEDLFSDVIAKAQRGLRLSNQELADRARVSEAAVEAVKNGATDTATLLRLAPSLGLHGPSLEAMADGIWYPEPVEIEGLARFTSSYSEMLVNSYLIWDAATREAAAFDTGANAQAVRDYLTEHSLNLRYLFLTHTHSDHVADIEGMDAPKILVSEVEPYPPADTFAPGAKWELGSLKVDSRLTWGHSQGGTTFVVHGLARPVAIVGDALFASSMGGGTVSWSDALATNRKEIFSLSDDTIICPGHGPMTTVGEEKAHNPFYPEYKH